MKREFWVYMLRCADGSYYIGQTDDLEARLAAHERGTTPGYTHQRRPLGLVWCQPFEDRANALEREHQIKRWSRAKKAALAANHWDRIRALARGTDRDPPS